MQTRCSGRKYRLNVFLCGCKVSVPYNILISMSLTRSKHPSAAMETSLLGLILSILCTILGSYWINRRRSKVPPGPPAMPVIGNLMQMPNELAYITFNDWARKYSAYHSFILTSIVLMMYRLGYTVFKWFRIFHYYLALIRGCK